MNEVVRNAAVMAGTRGLPTNILRNRSNKRPAGARSGSISGLDSNASAERHARLRAGRISLTIVLHPTHTADLIWRALPLYGIAETWGDALHFEVPVRAGRDRTARLNANPGDVCLWTEDARIIVAWGPTPISRPDEVRLMRPCNVWAHTVGDAAGLSVVAPGEKIVLERQPSRPGRTP